MSEWKMNMHDFTFTDDEIFLQNGIFSNVDRWRWWFLRNEDEDGEGFSGKEKSQRLVWCFWMKCEDERMYKRTKDKIESEKLKVKFVTFPSK